MKCLCCNKEIKGDSAQYELEVCWHKKCIKNFFGTSLLPEFDITEEKIRELAEQSISKGYTVTGVQKKISLNISKGKRKRMTIVDYPSGYILKPETGEYNELPEAEYIVMHLALVTGIKTVPFALISLNNKYAYITKRIDRIDRKDCSEKLAMEDFCQLDGRLTQDKYKGSYERCGKIINKYSHYKGYDISELFLRLVFSFVVGNSDMHLKNFSLIETLSGSSCYKLTEAYDLLPVNIILPEDEEEMALTLNEKKRNIRKKDFFIFAENIGLSKKIAENLIRKVVSKKDLYMEICKESLLSEDFKQKLCNLISERIKIFE